MKKSIIALIIVFAIITWACSDDVGKQMANPKAFQENKNSVCPDCEKIGCIYQEINDSTYIPVSYTHLRAHET
jgi:hypothetical protein